jgi:hypothetical protein
VPREVLDITDTSSSFLGVPRNFFVGGALSSPGVGMFTDGGGRPLMGGYRKQYARERTLTVKKQKHFSGLCAMIIAIIAKQDVPLFLKMRFMCDPTLKFF